MLHSFFFGPGRNFSFPGAWTLGKEAVLRFSFTLSLVCLESTAMPKATTQRKGSSLKHDPLAVQLRSGELDDAGVLSAPGKRQKEKRHQQEEASNRDHYEGYCCACD